MPNQDRPIDLCSEIIKGMERLGFKQSSTDLIKNNIKFIDALDKESNLQRTMLTMQFFDVLLLQPKQVPKNIRIALNVATNPLHWLEDMTSTVLPFMRRNEEDFFPTQH